MNPVGAENGMRIYEKINNDNFVSPLINKQCGLGSSGCSQSWHLHLKRFMKTDYTFDSTVMTSQLHGSNPSSVLF